jgi:plastocyanin domain-containing protein|tara:strand:+ start:46774 stop:47136 length:363 start_codon:yes stop_codon:yes gene_type:complete
METIIINFVGIVLIALIIWWFLIAKPMAMIASDNPIDIIVQNGVYSPSLIKTKVNQPIKLCFLRKDDTPCSEYVVFDDFNVSAKLPFNKKHIITITPKESGEYEFTCQMGMYRGKLVVNN